MGQSIVYRFAELPIISEQIRTQIVMLNQLSDRICSIQNTLSSTWVGRSQIGENQWYMQWVENNNIIIEALHHCVNTYDSNQAMVLLQDLTIGQGF